ncbi:hypothetical protein B0T19DRAFT_400319 [Cercophora scortea]|uniref:Uncharacterized protein n=1 Tax=Cercophora scortea TaxID=314031 RepID=A0AAE0MCI6_9PEZI|nr:hypothetical protein B0T19DRAFT_400319 [Cercophora scortea]
MASSPPMNVFNPLSQASAWVAMFGAPVVSTVTPDVSVAFSTTTETVPYTYIVISVSTAFSTLQETVTSYTTLYETVTSFTATSVSTVSTVVTATAQPAKKKKRSHIKRGKVCKAKSSTSSALPSSSSSSAPVVISSAPAITSTTSSAPLFTIAPSCGSQEEYSSACSCIGAVSRTSTVTAPAEVSTSTVTETTSAAVSSVSTSIVTVIRTSTVTAPALSVTLTAISAGIFLTTTTATSTTIAAAPTETSKIIVTNGANAGKYIYVLSSTNAYANLNTGSAGAPLFTIPSGGGMLSLASNPSKQLYLYLPGVSAGTLYFQTATYAAINGDFPVTCTLSDTRVLSCKTPARTWNTISLCNAYLKMSDAGWSPSVCSPLTLQLSA